MSRGEYIISVTFVPSVRNNNGTPLGGPHLETSHGAKENAEIFLITLGMENLISVLSVPSVRIKNGAPLGGPHLETSHGAKENTENLYYLLQVQKN